MKKRLESIFHKIWDIFSVVLVVIIFIGGSFVIYMYANGYRFSFIDNTIKKTGLISVESSPSGAKIYLNGVLKGDTPKILSYIDAGEVTITLEKDGYYTWTKKIPVLPEKSSPLNIKMIKTQAEKSELYSAKDVVNEVLNSEDGDVIIVVATTESKQVNLYRLDINRNFWDFSNNPKLIYSINDSKISPVKYQLSPDGKRILLTYKLTPEGSKTPQQKFLVIDTTKTASNSSEIDLQEFIDKYTISWAQDSNHLILESNDDIISLDTDNQAKYLLLKKTIKEPSIWATDNLGGFYILKTVKDQNISYYTLEQSGMNGSNRKSFIDRIYTTTDQKYIDIVKANPVVYQPFTSAPESTYFVGKITKVLVDLDSNGVIIQTNEATYWRDNSLNKFVMINNTPASLNSFAKDKYSLNFKTNTDQYGIFRFYKEENDPITQLGSTIINLNDDKIQSVSWINGENILIKGEKGLYVGDKTGENIVKVLDTTNKTISAQGTNSNLQDLYTVEKSENTFVINRYSIR